MLPYSIFHEISYSPTSFFLNLNFEVIVSYLTKKIGPSEKDSTYFSPHLPIVMHVYLSCIGFPCASVVKNLSANAGDLGPIPELGRSHGEVKGNPLQYSCLENPMDRRGWQATAHGGQKRVRHDLATKQWQHFHHVAIPSVIIVFLVKVSSLLLKFLSSSYCNCN